jgi:hypothetical protein
MKLYLAMADLKRRPMHVLGNASDVSRISNPCIRALVELRLQQLGDFADGLVLVVEAGDTVEELEIVSGCSILHDPFEDVPFGHLDFTPSFDYLETHYANGKLTCYEAHADTGDDGIGSTLFIPDEEGINSDLLALCRTYAQPAVTEP